MDGNAHRPPTGNFVDIERPENQDNFLTALTQSGNVTKSAKLANVHRGRLYEFADRDEEFRARFEAARQLGHLAMEDEARSRAIDGNEIPIWKDGKVVGYRTEKSDLLMIFLLKGAFPEKYKDRVENQNRDMDLAERLKASRLRNNER